MARNNVVPIRLSDEEKAKLQELAESERRSMVDWLREQIYVAWENLQEKAVNAS